MFKAILIYDGTAYFGWQKTASGPSIQEELEKAIARVTGETTLPEAASRTDRGVHARGQVAQFTLKKEIEPLRLQRALNAVLPTDIRVLKLEVKDFHPTLDARVKQYHYHLCQTPFQDPIKRLYSWHVHQPLDLAKMETAACDLVGTHDFTAFANEKEKDPICTLESIVFKDFFIIQGNRFLYKMVRNIVGTLVYVGCGKLSVDCIPEILASKDRKKAGITAPAHGLYLHEVFY
jgi:tRNA pseudouridine38-40 synthase